MDIKYGCPIREPSQFFLTGPLLRTVFRLLSNVICFLGIITTSYGSGKNPDDPSSLSITHQEILKAIHLDKPRWLLAHEHVVFARTFLKKLGYKGKSERNKLNLERNQVFTDLRILDLYEEAIIDHELPDAVPLDERKG